VIAHEAMLESSIPNVPVKRGKVRDIYDFGDRLLFVATDRISAYDWVLPVGIPDKGRVLTQLSEIWFQMLDTSNHMISVDLAGIDWPADVDPAPFQGRSMVVRKTEVVPIECVVRGYLSGSGWKEYQQSETVCGIKLPSGLQESDKLAEPIFTPATKADDGHDENISFDRTCEIIGVPLAEKLRTLSLDIYQQGAEYALTKGIIIADTKFEFGQIGDELILIDEVLTPDSSRFWPLDLYQPGKGQPSYDKQFVRDWLVEAKWDKNSPPPALPDDIVAKTRAKYIEAFEQIAGKQFPWA